MYIKVCRCVQATHNGKTPTNRIGALRQKMIEIKYG